MSQKNWDRYFYNICLTVSTNSKCLSRHIGAILVKDNSIISTGYNGPPRGIPHCGIRHQIDPHLLSQYKSIDKYFNENIEVKKCPRQILGYKSGEGLEWCVAGHSERNALIYQKILEYIYLMVELKKFRSYMKKNEKVGFLL